MVVSLRGEPCLLWRAVDEHRAELDVLLQKRRDKVAAKAEIPELTNVKHVFVKACARVNNRV